MGIYNFFFGEKATTDANAALQGKAHGEHAESGKNTHESFMAGILNSRFGWLTKNEGSDPAHAIDKSHNGDFLHGHAVVEEIDHQDHDLPALRKAWESSRLYANLAVGMLGLSAGALMLGGAPSISQAMLNSRRSFLSSIVRKPAMNRVLTPAAVFGLAGTTAFMALTPAMLMISAQARYSLTENRKRREILQRIKEGEALVESH